MIGCDICLENKNTKKSTEEIIKDIQKKMTGYGHDIRKLFDDNQLLCKKLQISVVSTFRNQFIHKYEILFVNNDRIDIRNFEAIRYGAFAKSPNYSYGSIKNNDKIEEFLNNLKNYVWKVFNYTAKELKK